ncbi:MAG TPA: hypothetical protein VMV10_15935 [Pirellulales bacterium]|nr:hypothetical protein [Pirellulales bacterium]
MPKIEYFLVAESYSEDKDSGYLSIFNVFNTVRFQKLPATIPKVVAISCWLSSAEEIEQSANAQVTLRFRLPGQPDPQEFRANFESDTRFQYVVLELYDVPVKEAGDILVELQLNGKHCATHTMSIAAIE